jgi:SAM-dependent methyltransferase
MPAGKANHDDGRALTMDQHPSDREWVKDFYESAADWWGESWYDGENLKPRLSHVERFAGRPPKNLLELGAGTGETAAFLAAAGYRVTAVDISEKNFQFLKEVEKKNPNISSVQGDFYTISIPEKFDAVCLFECFGMGSDQEQRGLLRRISGEWLAPGGVVLMDVYSPLGPVIKAGTSEHLDRLEHVPGSVEMTEHSYFDAVLSRWIDEWEPVENISAARRQSVRCYSPADLLLLLEGTGLHPVYAEHCGVPFDPQPSEISTSRPLDDYKKSYAFFTVLKKDG